MSTQIKGVIALSQDELNWHRDFVYACVMDNVRLYSPAKFGRELKYSIQELIHENVATLKTIGTQLERVIKDAGSSEFSSEGPLKINGVEGSKWVNFLKLQIRLTKVQEDAEEKAQQIKTLEAQLEDLKTPEEKKGDLQRQLAALKGETPGATAVPA